MSDRLLPYYKNIHKNELKFHIVEFSKRLLPELEVEISNYTYNIFKKRNIKIYLRTALESVSINKVFLSNGKTIDTKTIISTIGSTVPEIVKKIKPSVKKWTNSYQRVFRSEKFQKYLGNWRCSFNS